MISNEEAFAKAEFAVRQKEDELDRYLTKDEYEIYVTWFIRNLQNPYLSDFSGEPKFPSR
jgi:hypothetical protein